MSLSLLEDRLMYFCYGRHIFLCGIMCACGLSVKTNPVCISLNVREYYFFPWVSFKVSVHASHVVVLHIQSSFFKSLRLIREIEQNEFWQKWALSPGYPGQVPSLTIALKVAEFPKLALKHGVLFNLPI